MECGESYRDKLYQCSDCEWSKESCTIGSHQAAARTRHQVSNPSSMSCAYVRCASSDSTLGIECRPRLPSLCLPSVSTLSDAFWSYSSWKSIGPAEVLIRTGRHRWAACHWEGYVPWPYCWTRPGCHCCGCLATSHLSHNYIRSPDFHGSSNRLTFLLGNYFIIIHKFKISNRMKSNICIKI